ncbi:hypothetical protein BGZ61DRAFT_124564 [Ilyonectria robusta]|uniref:uncharacterized protein n=1 Tax=Ilyonectria robusta TaxID=1079257 RepID=UPI001E8DD6F7|nr:uncharacterized protein BGZ61DRAFT_124564 [Ilyonectria robusta]KAH8734428.1 hypothetical protein BGZ61DRAFT_124564 [Ilyonectria robusta]
MRGLGCEGCDYWVPSGRPGAANNPTAVIHFAPVISHQTGDAQRQCSRKTRCAVLRAGIPLARRRDRDEREPHIRYPQVEPWMEMESATMINGFGPTFLGDRSTTDNNYAYTNDAALPLGSIQHGLTETGRLSRLELMAEIFVGPRGLLV